MMNCLQSWPEPIVRVQSLSESGIKSIPETYIKPTIHRPKLNSTSTTEFDTKLNIPVIDLQNVFHNDQNVRNETLRCISNACREWGFFQIVNHGVDHELMRNIREIWREFFKLPVEMKQEYANSPTTYEGYGSRLGVEKGAKLDWSDYFFLHLMPVSLRKPDKWPALPTSCRELVAEYGEELVKLCGVIMKVLSVNLGLREEGLQNAFGGDEIGACLRVNFYPKCPQPDLTLGLSSHSDPGGMTLLLPDENVSGLQVRKNDNWVTVKPVPNAFIVNIGDQLQKVVDFVRVEWLKLKCFKNGHGCTVTQLPTPQEVSNFVSDVLSNAIYKSVEHRVIVNSAKERVSLAFFYNPKSDILIEPLKQLVTEKRPALYQAMTYDQYRLFIRMKGPCGKAQVESLKSNR